MQLQIVLDDYLEFAMLILPVHVSGDPQAKRGSAKHCRSGTKFGIWSFTNPVLGDRCRPQLWLTSSR